jgi:hypothetical protein
MSGDTMRDAMEAAFEEAENEEEETGGSPENASESLGLAPEGGEGEGEGEGEVSGAEGGQEDLGGEPAGGAPADDGIPVSADAGGDAGLSGDSPQAPVSWKPGIREHWKDIHPEVQDEIARREADHNKTLNDSAGFRKVADEYYRTVAPFQSLIQASNSTPAQAITNLMSTAAQLTQGTPARKAEVIRNIINEYGVDISMLDEVLAGQAPTEDPNAPLLTAIDERLAPITSFMGNVQQQQTTRNEAVGVEAATELATFATAHSEFYEDLRDDMADLLEMAANRGRAMTMEEAYERAAGAHPDIGPILSQRASAAAGKLDPAAAARKRNASSSIRGTQNSGQQAGGGEATVRGTIEELWDDAAGSMEH